MNFFDHQDAARRKTKHLVFLYILSIISIIFTIYGAVLITTAIFSFQSDRPRRLERSSIPTNSINQDYERQGLETSSHRGELVSFNRGRSSRSRSSQDRRTYRSPSNNNGSSYNYRSPSNNHNNESSYDYRRRQISPDRNRYPSRLSPNHTHYDYQQNTAIVSARSRRFELWQPHLFFISATCAILVIGAGSWYRLSTLQQGGARIAQELGGRLLLPELAETQEEIQLLNVVEEMAIASGVPLPLVYVLDAEGGINAFAAGYMLEDAAIGVTRGALEKLTRDEIQGVIAHEFSHILNGDMKLNLQLIAALHGIMMIFVTGRLLMPSGYERLRIDATTFLGVLLMGIGYVGYFWGRIIQSAVSRQREYLADASATQFTRNPEGLASALEKIAGKKSLSRMNSPHAVEMSHMLFADGLRLSWLGDLSANYGTPVSVSNSQESVKMAVATPTWLTQLPEELQIAIQEPSSAIALVYALLLAPDNPSRQVELLHQVESPDMVEAAIALAKEIVSVDRKWRSPLLDLSLAALRQIPPEASQKLFQCLQGLGKLDEESFVTELVIYSVLSHHLQPIAESSETYATLDLVWDDCLTLFSLLAHLAQSNPDAIAYTFRSALDRLPGARGQEFPDILPSYNFSSLNQSLERLARASAKLKQAIADACFYMVTLDRQVSDAEADLMWAIAITLNRPLPPFLKRHFS
jgi:Zn-dependent protease with chaperone function